ncbi:hypothetical protein ACFSHQ_24280 [Gemmobacter lanyuensis]
MGDLLQMARGVLLLGNLLITQCAKLGLLPLKFGFLFCELGRLRRQVFCGHLHLGLCLQKFALLICTPEVRGDVKHRGTQLHQLNG